MSGIQERQKNQKPVQNVDLPTGIENGERKKKCSKCGVEKGPYEFGRRKDSKDGLKGECKPCAKIYASMHYQNNKKHHAESGKLWRKNNLAKSNSILTKYRNSEKGKETHKQWLNENKDKISCGKKEHYLNNKDEISDYKKSHYQKNRQKIISKKPYAEFARRMLSNVKKSYFYC